MRMFGLLLLPLALAACPAPPPADGGVNDAGVADGGWVDAGDDDAGVVDGGAPDGGDDVDAGPAARFVIELDSEDTYQALAGDTGQVKYLAPVLDVAREAPLVDDCYFQNMTVTPWHIEFLHGFDELSDMTYQEYVDGVLKKSTRFLWGGSVFRRQEPHPLNGGPTLAYSVYAEDSPGNRLEVDELVEVHGILQACIPYASEELVFQPQGPAQVSFVDANLDVLVDAGIGVLR